MAGRGRGKARGNISYVKPAEPAFIRRMKQQVGFKEGPNVDTKREQLPRDDDQEDAIRNKARLNDDEKPQVVVLGPGDLTSEEVDEIFDRLSPPNENQKSIATVEAEEEVVEDEQQDRDDIGVGTGKISFRKPEKRQSGDGGDDDDGNDGGLNVSSNKKRRNRKYSGCRKSSEMQKVKNRSLLSFDDNENDDDDD